METAAWHLYAVLYDLNIDRWSSQLYEQHDVQTGFQALFSVLSHFWNAELVITFTLMLSTSLNVFFSIHVTWKKCSPKPENVDWHVENMERLMCGDLQRHGISLLNTCGIPCLKLSKYLSQGRCSVERFDEVQLIWGLACANRALCNTILERESFRAEVQAKGGSLQIKPDQSQEVPFLMSVAPLEGQKWKWVSSHPEQKEDTEEVEEDPGQGPSPKPPSLRKAMEKTKRCGEESKEEEVTVTTTRRTLKMTEIQGSRKEFILHGAQTKLLSPACFGAGTTGPVVCF